MSARVTHEAVITTGTYKDRQTGEEKKRYQKIGVVFTNEQGQMSLKLDALPCGPNWSGFVSLYPKESNNSQSRQAPQSRPSQGNQQPNPTQAQQAATIANQSDEDIPF